MVTLKLSIAAICTLIAFSIWLWPVIKTTRIGLSLVGGRKPSREFKKVTADSYLVRKKSDIRFFIHPISNGYHFKKDITGACVFTRENGNRFLDDYDFRDGELVRIKKISQTNGHTFVILEN